MGGFDGAVELGDLLLEGGDELVEAVELGLEFLAQGVIGGERRELLRELGFAGAGLVEGGSGLVSGGLEVGGVFYAGHWEKTDEGGGEEEGEEMTRGRGDTGTRGKRHMESFGVGMTNDEIRMTNEIRNSNIE